MERIGFAALRLPLLASGALAQTQTTRDFAREVERFSIEAVVRER